MSPHVSATGPDASGSRATASPAMLDVFDLAARLKISTRHLRRLIDAGKCPQPVRLGRSCRWPATIIEQWLADGCPNCRKRPGVTR